jgi:hypothetical protein
MLISRRLFGFLVLLLACAKATCAQTIYCPSDDGRLHHCDADTRGGVQLANQRSGSPCTQGYSWGYDARGIWVDHGCRADFALGAVPPPDEGDRVISCSSDDGGRNFCPFDTRHGVRLVNQRSGSPCKQGYSWDFDNRGIWVDHGCRGEFSIDREEVEREEEIEGFVSSETITCSSDDGRRKLCEVDTRKARVIVVKQRSGSPCEIGSSWGTEERGIWVDRGCRADFLVERRGPDVRHENCISTAGMEQADELSNRCLNVAPGKWDREYCDPQNTCKMIIDEIRKGCRLLGSRGPGFCDEYK